MIHIFQQRKQQLPQTSESMNKTTTNTVSITQSVLHLWLKMLKLQQCDFVVDDKGFENGFLALVEK